MNRFDLLNSPLQGRNLIEASAGTGKTYAIAGLYLRLLLEKRILVDQILVVTFTVAATEELRGRIRTRIKDALNAFTSGASEDDFLAGLVKKFGDTRTAKTLLTNALRCFDEAAVFTIHGFCRRILQEKAFECGSVFNTELATDQSALVQEVVDDFWRIHIYPASPGFLSFVRSKKNKGWSPEALARFVERGLGKFKVRVIPEIELSETQAFEKTCTEVFAQVRRKWPGVRDEIEDILLSAKSLNRNKYQKKSILIWIENLNQYLAAGNLFPCFDKLEKFTVCGLKKAVKKGYQPPQHPFFDLVDTLNTSLKKLETAFDQQLLALKRKLLTFVRSELSRRKKEQNIRSFDDLLLSVQAALKDGEGLGRTLREKYRAALIDEFQDTDPVQYAIFKTIYPSKDNILFLIGDPKQAIYSFRGADLFAYLEAAGDVETKYTLDTNWRSGPSLIRAVNTIFSNRDNPFVFKEIVFHPVKPSATKHLPDTWLQIWFMSRTAPDGPINKGEAAKLLPEAVASEIGRLLKAGQGNLIDGRSVAPEDIAVLVRTNLQARTMQEALQRRGIPAVLYSSESLFASREAEELLRIMLAVADPTNEAKIKTAMTTDLIGVSGNELASLIDQEAGWAVWLEKFRDYHQIWAQGPGFMLMARTLIAKEGIKSRLLAYSDGERRLTNLLHCLEVLHQASLENSLEGLLKWFVRQIKERPEKDEYQIRLETDEKAVKLVTIHKSKGLEYPIVFCPYCWRGSRAQRASGALEKDNETLFFHDPEQGHQATLVLGSQNLEPYKSLAEQEILAENLRLLYVALTRARYRCYLVWGAIRESETSAPAYLFHPPDEKDPANSPLETTADWVAGLDDQKMLKDLETLALKAAGTIRVSSLPAPDREPYQAAGLEKNGLCCRVFSGHIPDDWRIASFSSLVSGQIEWWPDPGEEVKEAQGLPEASKLAEVDSIFDFPRGALAGTCLHDILEKLDFRQKTSEATERLVRERLAAYGFDLDWTLTVCSMLERLLNTPLVDGRADFTLGALGERRKNQAREMEFYLPMGLITSNKLAEVFAASSDSKGRMIEKLNFRPVRGMLKGYIDLVFCFDGRYYLVDYKSNYLGPRLEDYQTTALAVVMEREYYFLQSHLYTVGLHKYLAHRLSGYDYQTHFGGVFYIFLRGVDPGHGPRFGIYQHRPPVTLIDSLEQYLA